MPGISPSLSDYACLADSAAYLSRFARGVATELGREDDPEAEGKCETFLCSLCVLRETLSKTPDEPYFGPTSGDARVQQFAERLREAGRELIALEVQLESHRVRDVRDKRDLLALFLRIKECLTELAEVLKADESHFRDRKP